MRRMREFSSLSPIWSTRPQSSLHLIRALIDREIFVKFLVCELQGDANSDALFDYEKFYINEKRAIRSLLPCRFVGCPEREMRCRKNIEGNR
jgi:hypothetical protein